MSNSQHISAYNFTHISSYVTGTMSREEMYTFEKAMQYDPFLEDAVIGYKAANIKQADADLVAITAAINKQEDKKIISFYSQQKTWLQAAAMVILVAGLGTITYSIFNTNKISNKQIAVVNTKPEAPLLDSTKRIKEILVAANKVDKIASHKHLSKTIVTNIAANEKLIVAKQEAIASNLSSNPIKIDTSKLQNFNGDAVAKVKAEDLEKTSVTNINQALQARTAGVIVNKNKVKNVERANTITANNAFTNASNKNKDYFKIPKNTQADSLHQALNEVVVIGYGSAKKKDLSTTKMVINPLDSLMPVGGWQYYSKYINQKIGLLGDTTAATQLVLRDKFGNKLDDVDFEFSLDKEGKAYDVKIVNYIDSLQAKTIANIVSEGPKWNTKKRKKNKVKISLKNP